MYDGIVITSDIGPLSYFDGMMDYDGVSILDIGDYSAYSKEDRGGGGEVIRQLPLLVRSNP